MPEAAQVRAMFGRIAGRYDLANHLLSLGADYGWRRRLVARARAARPARLADLATGSGDVALALRRGLGPSVAILGLDFCEPMLEVARRKAADLPADAAIEFRPGDCLALPLADSSQDVVTIAFGLRNLADRPRGLAEMRRVLRPGGRVLCLEFSQPQAWFRPLYYAYLKGLLPAVAAVLTGRREAYRYLAGSIASFPTREALSAEFSAAGFAPVEAESMTFGIVALHQAVRPAP